MHGHGLDELSSLHLGHTNIKFEEVCGKGKGQISFGECDLEKARDYAAEDADMTLRLHTLLKPRLVPERMASVYATLERPLIPVLVAMERTGIQVDPVTLRETAAGFLKREVTLAAESHALVGAPVNALAPNMHAQQHSDITTLRRGQRR